MPKLLLFTPCEKIIIDDNNNVSLVVLLHEITAVPSEKGIPKNAVTPKEWAVYTTWVQEDGDENKSYIQWLQIQWPDGSEFEKYPLPFVFKKRRQQNRVNIVGFPIGQPGLLTIKMWLESDGAKVTEVYSHTLEITHAGNVEE